MLNKKTIIWLFVCLVLFQHCSKQKISKTEQLDLEINLRWSKGYKADSPQNAELGLKWILSYLGAYLPKGSFEQAIEWTDETHFVLDLSKVGFGPQSEKVMHTLLKKMRESEEYSLMNGLDIGRFVMLTLGSSNHYYALTETPESLQAFKKQYQFDDKKYAMFAGESGIAVGERIVEIGLAKEVQDIAFVGLEGLEKSIEDLRNGENVNSKKSIVAEEFETLRILPNSLPHFALYDKSGKLKVGATKDLSRAGKPAKCLWCHLGLNPPFSGRTDVEGFYTIKEFKNVVSAQGDLINSFRANIETELDFSTKQNRETHTIGELLYLTFMEPSARRLALEWGMKPKEVRQLLKGIPTHVNDEFHYLDKSLYHRKDIEKFAPYQYLQVPESAREPSAYEPNFLVDSL